MRLSYAEPETVVAADSCFSKEEQEFLVHQIISLEGKTEKQKNPYKAKDLKRYVWAIARLGGWKGYESKRHPGITTLWIGVKYFKAAMQGWMINRNVSTRQEEIGRKKTKQTLTQQCKDFAKKLIHINRK